VGIVEYSKDKCVYTVDRIISKRGDKYRVR
jgi:hypothetical protein